jgi:hypothetical protein
MNPYDHMDQNPESLQLTQLGQFWVPFTIPSYPEMHPKLSLSVLVMFGMETTGFQVS